MIELVVSLLLLIAGLLATWTIVQRLRHGPPSAPPDRRRILFPFAGGALSQEALDAAFRLARAEHATLVPALLARVPMSMPLSSPLPRACLDAMPLLEAIEQRAAHEHVPVDARIERGRTYRHAIRELLAHERYDRIVVAAAGPGRDGFDAGDVAWLLEQADGEILVLRPAQPARDSNGGRASAMPVRATAA